MTKFNSFSTKFVPWEGMRLIMFITRKTYKVIRKNRSLQIDKIKEFFMFLFVIIMLILGGICIKFGIDTKNNKKQIYNFYAEKNSDYEILLNPNDFYMTETLPAGRFYVSKSIDKIKINFDYNFKSDVQNSTYNITANLIGKANTTDNESKEIWTRTFNLLDEKKAQSMINEIINIDYSYFYNLAHSFENQYGLSIETTIKVRLNVKHSNFEDYIELDIPINNTVTDIKENYEKITTKNIDTSNEENITRELSFYIIGSVLILGAIAIGVFLIINYRNNKTPEEKYLDNINRILKYYKDLIVTVEQEPDLKGLNVLKVVIFEDLIDVAEQNKTNIIHHEVKQKNESRLYVILDKYVYMYVCN